MDRADGQIDLTVVTPAHDEQDNVAPLVAEIVRAVEPLGLEYEIIVVDDGSTDETGARLRALLAEQPRFRVLEMLDTPPGRGHGQSAAFRAAFRTARGDVLALLDADLQNDPADIPAMLEKMRTSRADLVQGDRSANRRDNVVRRCSSWVGRVFRRVLLGDTIRDSACSMRVMTRELALALPMEFRGMHRFVAVTARHMGRTVVEVPVNHRPRTAGEPKYGVWDRAWVGIPDCLAVRWMSRRRRRPTAARSVAAPTVEPPVVETVRSARHEVPS